MPPEWRALLTKCLSKAGGRLLLSRLTAPASPAHLPCGQLPYSALPRWGLFLQQYISIKLLSMNEMREAERGGRGHCHSCLALVRIIGGAEVASQRKPGGARSPGGASRAAVLYVGGVLSPGMSGGADGRCAERGRVVRLRVGSGAGRHGPHERAGGRGPDSEVAAFVAALAEGGRKMKLGSGATRAG